MALAFKISQAVGKAMADALSVLLDAGKLRIYSGAAPANVEDAATGTLLAEITIGADFSAAATSDAAKATLTMLGVPLSDADADNTGTAGYFRLTKADGTAVAQGTVGVGVAGTDYDCAIDNTSIVQHGTVTCTGLVITMPIV